jgi:hypothetical protein
MACEVDAATYWVGKNGSDSRSCAQAQDQSSPKQTINAGASCLSSGDTLMIQAGTYQEVLNNVIPSGGGEGSRTVVKAASPGSVTIAPSGVDVALTIGPNRSYITVDGLIIDGSNLNGWALQLGGDDASTHHIRIQQTEVHHARYFTGIVFRSSSHTDQTFFELINVESHHNGWDCYDKPGNLCHGGYMGSSNNLIDGGSYHDHPYGHGIQFYSGGMGGSNNVIKNAKFYGNGTQGLGVYPGDHNEVLCNVFTGNGGSGLRIVGSNALVKSNTFDGNDNDINCEGMTSGSIVGNSFNSSTAVIGCSWNPSQNGAGYAGADASCGGAGVKPPAGKLPPPKNFRIVTRR